MDDSYYGIAFISDEYARQEVLSICKQYIERNQCCVTCRHYEIQNGVCCYYKSDYVADFRDFDHWCEYWEENE